MVEMLAEKTGFRVVGNYGYVDYLEVHARRLGEVEGKKRPLVRYPFNYRAYLDENRIYIHQIVQDDGRLWYYGDGDELLLFILGEMDLVKKYMIQPEIPAGAELIGTQLIEGRSCSLYIHDGIFYIMEKIPHTAGFDIYQSETTSQYCIATLVDKTFEFSEE